MKNLRLIFILLFPLLYASCETTTAPSNNSQIPTNITTLFVRHAARINIQLSLPPPANVYPEVYGQNDWLSPYCWLSVGFWDTSRTMIDIDIQATNLTPGPVTGLIKVTLGDNAIYEPVTVNVIDFYPVSRLENNANDTIKLKSGISFLLQLTCRDSVGNIVSIKQVGRLLDGSVGSGYVVWPLPHYTYETIFCSSYSKDTTSAYYLFATVPDVTFSPYGTGPYFQMQISNKVFKIPIALVN